MSDKKKILIVEDDQTLQKTLSEYLTEQGFEVACAGDGEKGVEMAKEIMPDLVLLDIVLPKKDGYQVMRELKADDAMKSLIVIFLTNLASVNDVEKAIELGATTYLVKADYKLEDVAKKIRETLKME